MEVHRVAVIWQSCGLWGRRNEVAAAGWGRMCNGWEGRQVAMPLCLCDSSMWAGRRLHVLTPLHAQASGLGNRSRGLICLLVAELAEGTKGPLCVCCWSVQALGGEGQLSNL